MKKTVHHGQATIFIECDFCPDQEDCKANGCQDARGLVDEETRKNFEFEDEL